MKNLLLGLSLIYLLFSPLLVRSQYAVLPGGGYVVHNSSELSYSIGQIAYHQIYDGDAFAIEGMQHPVEVTSSFAKSIPEVSVEVSLAPIDLAVYPNPTTGWLNLEIAAPDLADFHYDLIDLSGRKIIKGQVNSFQTRIDLELLPAGTYCLTVSQNTHRINVFKIVKQ